MPWIKRQNTNVQRLPESPHMKEAKVKIATDAVKVYFSSEQV